MTKSELEKLASKNPDVLKALAVFAEGIEKKADEGTFFNESVPAQGSEGAPPADPGAGQVAAPQAPPPEAVAPPAAAIPQDPNAMPVEESGLNPSEEGATAAQVFLAPVFAAAAQGDPNAQGVIAKAAGEVAKGVAAAAAEAMGGAPTPVAPIAAPPTPEEEVANKIVPPKKSDDEQKEDVEEGTSNGAPPKENNEGPEKISMDLDMVSKIIKMVRAKQL